MNWFVSNLLISKRRFPSVKNGRQYKKYANNFRVSAYKSFRRKKFPDGAKKFNETISGKKIGERDDGDG